jgi:hypothetical protein
VAKLNPWALGSLFVFSYDKQGCGGGILTRLHMGKVTSNWPDSDKFKFYCDRRSVGQFVFVSDPLWGPWADFNFLWLTITFFLLHVRFSLWREEGSVTRSAINHRLESRRTHSHTLLSHLRLPPPGWPGPRIYIPQEQSGPVISPGTGFPFRRLLRLAGIRRKYSNPSPHGAVANKVKSRSKSNSKSKLYCDWRLVGQSVLVSGTHLGCENNFSPSSFNYF